MQHSILLVFDMLFICLENWWNTSSVLVSDMLFLGAWISDETLPLVLDILNIGA